jgi:hypothetical protein
MSFLRCQQMSRAMTMNCYLPTSNINCDINYYMSFNMSSSMSMNFCLSCNMCYCMSYNMNCYKGCNIKWSKKSSFARLVIKNNVILSYFLSPNQQQKLLLEIKFSVFLLKKITKWKGYPIIISKIGLNYSFIIKFESFQLSLFKSQQTIRVKSENCKFNSHFSSMTKTKKSQQYIYNSINNLSFLLT